MEKMLHKCYILKKVNFNNFDTSKVEKWKAYLVDEEIKGINKFNTSKANNMGSMLYYCEGSEYLDLSNFETSEVKHMGHMFYGCKELK